MTASRSSVSVRSVLVGSQLFSAETEADAWDRHWERRLAATQAALKAAAQELQSHLSFAQQVSKELQTTTETSTQSLKKHSTIPGSYVTHVSIATL